MDGRFGQLANVNRWPFVAVLSVAGTLAFPCAAQAGCGPKDLECQGNQAGIILTATSMVQLPLSAGPGGSGGAAYEYDSSTMCGGVNVSDPGHDELCTLSLTYCPNPKDAYGDGPAVYVFRRQANPVTDWQVVGHTCWPELIPGPRTPTMAMVENAFHRTPFAQPGVHIQPEGNRTLVTLPTYFALEWSEQGYQPEEIDTLNPAQWYGLTVRVKPIFRSVTYDFGDGTSHGPTTDLGGLYPTGSVTKTYESGGVYDIVIRAVLTGQVSLNGSEWMDIPGQADLTGPVTPLTVLTATNRLYATPNG